jgi:hypothetical protein|tara:strand:+ start:385 stop:795 length:411 start_codon:yes stop_codon:yes gene_type:complete
MRTLFLVLSFILIVSAITSDAKAVNEYLNSNNSCERGRIEFYTEFDRQDYDQRMSSSSDYFSDSGKVGIRFTYPLQSSCTKDSISLMHENDRLKQQLELLKLCGRYQELELSDDFKDIREKCKGIKLKEKTDDNAE